MARNSENSEDKLCAVKYCCNQYTSKEDVSYFSLPMDLERRAIWFENCFPNVADKQSISLHSRICQDHFENEMFIDIREKNRLTDFAFPTLFNSEILARRRYSETIIKMPVINAYWSYATTGSNSNSSLTCSTDLSYIKLQSELYKAQCRIKELEDTVLKLSKLSVKDDTKENFLKSCEKYFSPNLLVILKSYLICKETKSDTIIPVEEIRKFALTIYSLSPTTYNLIKKDLSLPNIHPHISSYKESQNKFN